jgi:hypothetical protein
LKVSEGANKQKKASSITDTNRRSSNQNHLNRGMANHSDEGSGHYSIPSLYIEYTPNKAIYTKSIQTLGKYFIPSLIYISLNFIYCIQQMKIL